MSESIRKDQEFFLMDYASSMEECNAEIEVKICTKAEVESAVRAKEMYKKYMEIDDEIIGKLKISKNENYLPITQKIGLALPKDEASMEILIQHV